MAMSSFIQLLLVFSSLISSYGFLNRVMPIVQKQSLRVQYSPSWFQSKQNHISGRTITSLEVYTLGKNGRDYLDVDIVDKINNCRQWQQACLLFNNEINNRLPAKNDVWIYNAVLSSCAKSKDQDAYQQSLIIHNIMTKKKKVLPNAATYGVLVHTCNLIRPDGWEHVLYIVDEMLCQGLTPSVTILNVALKACSNAKPIPQFEKALFLYEKVFKEFNLLPDQYTYSCVINICGKVKLYQKAEDIYNTMIGLDKAGGDKVNKAPYIKPNIYILNGLINSFGNEGNINKALKYYHSMRDEHGIQPDTISCFGVLQAYRNNITNFLSTGSTRCASQEEEDSHMDSLIGEAVYFVKNTMNHVKPNIQVINTILFILSTSSSSSEQQDKWFDLALQIFEKDLTSEYKLVPDPYTFSIMLKNCEMKGTISSELEMKKKTKAFEIFDSIKSKYRLNPNIYHYNSILQQPMPSFQDHMDMFKQLCKSEGVQPDGYTFSILIRLCGRFANKMSVGEDDTGGVNSIDICEKTKSLYELMQTKYNIKPNLHIVNALIATYDAFRAYDKVIDLFESLGTSQVNVAPNIKTISFYKLAKRVIGQKLASESGEDVDVDYSTLSKDELEVERQKEVVKLEREFENKHVGDGDGDEEEDEDDNVAEDKDENANVVQDKDEDDSDEGENDDVYFTDEEEEVEEDESYDEDSDDSDDSDVDDVYEGPLRR